MQRDFVRAPSRRMGTYSITSMTPKVKYLLRLLGLFVLVDRRVGTAIATVRVPNTWIPAAVLPIDDLDIHVHVL